MKPYPTIDLAHDVIESIVSLTEKRDQHSLEQSLMKTLAEMLGSVEGWLLDMPQKPDDSNGCHVLHGNPARLPRELIEQGCRLPPDASMHTIARGDLTYLLAELHDAEEDRRHLVILAQEEWEQIDLQVVQGMIQVYRNFVAVLYDSEKDTLTGLYNRRKLDSKLKDIANARLQGRRQTDKEHADFLAILDLDRFKRINDTFGHLIGDEVLLIFANILRKTLRDSDLIFRYGGEEFIVLLQDIAAPASQEVLERVRRNVERHRFPQVGEVTVSIGYTVLDSTTLPILAMGKADRALYYAKDHGRNQVCDFDRLLAEGKLEDLHQEGSIELF
jgi:diguanylate cyclase (GGDEF)-like protein